MNLEGTASARTLRGYSPTKTELHELLRTLKGLREELLEHESHLDLHQFGEREPSARNLLHYLALRSKDIRDLQDRLELLGISSLGRSEGHVLYNLEAVMSLVRGITHEPEHPEVSHLGVSPKEGRRILESNTNALFARREGGRTVRVMVTMPTEAASEYSLVRGLVEAGMDCMRINCAHDRQVDWLQMVANLRRAEREVGRKCTLLMDIAGPKLRTGGIAPGPQVVRLRPLRNAFGEVTEPLKVLLRSEAGRASLDAPPLPVLNVESRWIRRLKAGSVVSFRDARNAKRTLKVLRIRDGQAEALLYKSAYLRETTTLHLGEGRTRISTPVLAVPHREGLISLRKGDAIVLTADQASGEPGQRGEPARIPCTLPHALGFIQHGESVWFDDGKIGGMVRAASRKAVRVEITHAAPEGSKLRSDKSINLPDTNLRMGPLTPKDREDLDFIAQHADLVGYSFVRTPYDVRTLRSELEKRGRGAMGIALKIETRKAFDHLPSLLLEALRGPCSGIMVARGDLAVECGYERLAEVQEEILWMAEAAHVPAIWATQVLEGLTKNGVPSRAEITDAAMGGRSECVMLNKGPHVIEALKALDSILRRMQAHQNKKRSMMRQLNIASDFFKSVEKEEGFGKTPPTAALA